MQIIKRNGTSEEFNSKKIVDAICKAMLETDEGVDQQLAQSIADMIETVAEHYTSPIEVEEVQDIVENKLMDSDRKDVAKRYIIYRNGHTLTRDAKWEMTELQENILQNKYKNEGESFGQWLERISGGNEQIRKLIRKKQFIFAGRILANRGMYKEGRKVTYSNCYVLPAPNDNIESIFGTAGQLARTFSYGGGVGFSLGNLRPRGAKVNNSAKQTTGAVSFSDLYSLTTDLIGQNGRRGALMLSIPSHHPDILEFIKAKRDLNRITKANISVMASDKFMWSAKEDEEYKLWHELEDGERIEETIKGRDVFHELARSNHMMAEPKLNWAS